MNIENFDLLYFNAMLLEMALSRAILDQNFIAYNLLALRYKELAEGCQKLTLNWRL